MNLEQEWRIMVNMARRRLDAGIDDVSDRAIVEMNAVYEHLNTDNTALNELKKRVYNALGEGPKT